MQLTHKQNIKELQLKLGFSHSWGVWSRQQVGMMQVTQVLVLQDMATNDAIAKHTLAATIPFCGCALLPALPCLFTGYFFPGSICPDYSSQL